MQVRVADLELELMTNTANKYFVTNDKYIILNENFKNVLAFVSMKDFKKCNLAFISF